MTAYQTTTVSTSKSQESIRKILQEHNVRGVQFGEDFETHSISVRFGKVVNGNVRTVSVTMKVPEPPTPKHKRRSTYRYGSRRMVYDKTPTERQDQMIRSTYRALHYWLKSQFEAVDFGLLSFEDVFLSHFEWMIGDKMSTVGKLLNPYLSQPQLNAPAPDDILDGEVSE